MADPRFRHRGFTLVEAVIAIALTGILAGIVAMYLRGPILAYFDAVRRADLTDAADGAARRMARDVQGALPNSVRVSGSGQFIEFLPVKDGGRYRAELTPAGTGDILDFSSGTDGRFDVLGPTVTVASGDSVVVYNLGQTGADAYEGTSRRAVAAPFVAGLSQVNFTATGTPFPFASPASRFQIIGTPVTYQCDLAAGVVRRWWGYAIQATQPTSATTLNGLSASSAILTDRVSSCAIVYSTGTSQRLGLVTIKLVVTQSGENVSLVQQVNVVNTP